jgi:signal transduction histidine kinase
MHEFLKKVPLFADLADDDLKHLCKSVEEVQLLKGDTLFEEGSPGDRAFIIRDGEIEIIKKSRGREVLLATRKSGEVFGEMALFESAPRMASARAGADSLLYAIGKTQFDHLITTSISAANAMFYTILARYRATEALLRQSEKMAELGKLTAGVAHELNNPASAVKRSATLLDNSVKRYDYMLRKLLGQELSPKQMNIITDLTDQVREQATQPPELDSLLRSDREEELENWLDQQGIDNAWDLAVCLVDVNIESQELTELSQNFEQTLMSNVLDWLSANYTLYNLKSEIRQGAGQISEIVAALKSYSYMDRAPIQTIDVHEGLDNTLLILRNKLKTGMSVRKEYAENLPKINAYASELNQVWTNIIDNAIDAQDGNGEIIIRTKMDHDDVVVEIEDRGPGIPPEILPRIFDPFFTTKPPGQGTGLGLDISYNIIVQKHKGDIKVDSQPGKTVFQIRLPVDFKSGR